MTIIEFKELSAERQEDFINNGGIISKDSDSEGRDSSDVELGSPAQCNHSSNNTKLSLDSFSGEFTGAVSLPEVKTEVTSDLSLESEVKDAIGSPQSFNTFDIADPVELLFLLDDNIAQGKVVLHSWQLQFLLDFAKGGQSDLRPFQAAMRACNGSGKDKYILAPCAVWLCMKHFKARAIVTSSSGVQLDNQTCAYISQLTSSANRKFGNVWKSNYRFYQCLDTSSPIICYATDEPGKAEGFHPLEYGAKMAILVSEDKSIPDEINIALNKCTGYTHRCHVSTPGNAFGHFFDLCSTSVNRTDIVDISCVKAEDYIQYHITADMCPHLSESYIRQMKRDLPGGEGGAAFKSQILAEFGTTDEMVVIPYSYIWKAKHAKDDKWIVEDHNNGGLDLSDGGDETALVVRNGNKVLKVIPFRFDNAEDTIAFLQEKFRENNLVHKEALIFADCGGSGKPMLDRLKRLGWSNIRYCDNRAKTNRPKTYKNWGAQSWFHLGDLFKQGELIIPSDDKLVTQLSTRYYKIIDGAIHQLLSKIEMRSRGYSSPDRADAMVLAFSNYKSVFIENKDKDAEKPFEIEEEIKYKNDFSIKAYATGYGDKKWRANEGQKDFSSLEDEIAEYNRNLVIGK